MDEAASRVNAAPKKASNRSQARLITVVNVTSRSVLKFTR